MAILKEIYAKDVAPALMQKFGYKSVMQIPKLEKVIVNVGSGEAKDNALPGQDLPSGQRRVRHHGLRYRLCPHRPRLRC